MLPLYVTSLCYLLQSRIRVEGVAECSIVIVLRLFTYIIVLRLVTGRSDEVSDIELADSGTNSEARSTVGYRS